MTKEELHKVGTALAGYNRWLADTEKGEAWHATRQQLWAHAERQIAALVDKPETQTEKPKKDNSADKKPDKNPPKS